MERRDFLKISAAGGAAAALEGCGNPDHHLIRFIPEEDLVPGNRYMEAEYLHAVSRGMRFAGPRDAR